MTRPEDPMTREEFDEAVRNLLNRAHENGIPVEDGIDVRNPDSDMPSWTVEVTRLAERE